MFSFKFAKPTLAAAALLLAAPLNAQTVLVGHHSIEGDLCAGTECTGSESFAFTSLKLKEADVGLLFEDTTDSPYYAGHDWRITINNPFANLGYFAIEDIDGSGTVFHIESGARPNAIYLSDNGNIGFGTSNPLAELHVLSGDRPSLLLAQDGSGGFSSRSWRLDGYHNGFELRDVTGNKVPFQVKPGSGNHHALTIAANGDIGLGTSNPSAPLHLVGSGGNTKLLVQENSGTSTPRTMLDLSNNGRPEIVMANTATDGEWSFGAGANFVLKQGSVGSSASSKTKYFTLKSGSGDLEIAGQIITGGPTCELGCDAVFNDDYALPSIREHADKMFKLGYLPNVGPTTPDQAVNLTDKLGRVLNELEHAHIYIAELESRLSQLEAKLAD